MRYLAKDLRKNPWLYFHLGLLLFIGIVCFVGPFFYNQDYRTQNLLLGAQAPSWEHILGTDALGRDLFARLLYGGRISIVIGFLSNSFTISLIALVASFNST